MSEIELDLARGPDGADDTAGPPPVAALADAAAERGLLDVAYATTDTPIGPVFLAVTPRGLVRVVFAWAYDVDEVLDEVAARLSPRILESPARTDSVRRQFDEYFDGRRQAFDVPVDWELSRGFRRTVLQHCYRIPYGTVTTYKDLATESGSPRASRAVGSAMATNPVPIVVPCHRVLRTGGHLGGYGGGLDRKQWLLKLEGALL